MSRRAFLALITLILAVGTPSSVLAQTDGSAVARGIKPHVAHDYSSLERFIEADEIGVARPAGVAWDAVARRLQVFDATPGRGVSMTTAGAARAQIAGDGSAGVFRSVAGVRIDRAALGADLRGLAIDPVNRHLFTFAPATRMLWELDPTGAPISRRDLSSAGLIDVRAIAIAPTADSTDAEGRMAAYVADAGRLKEGAIVGAGVHELALSAPVDSPANVAAATSSVTLVNTFNTGAGSSNWTPDSPDPSGLTYIPSTDRLVAADGEVDETTGAGWHDANVWFATRAGQSTSTMDTTAVSPSNNEPVGVAYDGARNELYISKDGGNGRIWVYNASSLTVVRSFTVTGAPYNNADAEGLAFGNGVLYMVDAIDNDLVKVQPGGNGVVGTGNDDVVTNFDLQQYGQSEPEGLDVHPTTGNIWVASNKVSGGGTPDPMIEVSPNGALVSTVSIAAANPDSAGGLAIAPPSNGSGGFSIYIADRGVDNGSDPNENDGRIYEFGLDGGGGAAPVANFTWAQVPGTLTVNFTDTSTNNPDEWAWAFGDPAGSTSAAQNPSFTYPAPGDYQVTLDVANPNGSDGITKTVTVTDPSGGGNLMANPGFELDANGDTRPDNWTTNNAFTRSSAVVHGGSFAGRHQSTGNVGYNVYQVVTGITAGTPYTFDGWLNIPSTSDKFTFKIQLKWRSASGSLSTSTILTRKVSTAGWLQVSGGATAPASATNVRVTMTLNSLNATIYVDDFSLD